MQIQEALDLLDLPSGAGDDQITQQVEKRRADLEKRVVSAPTMSLKAKYRAELARLETAISVLQSSSEEVGHDYSDLPVPEKIAYDEGDTSEDEYEEDGAESSDLAMPSGPAGRRPPSRGAALAPSGRKRPSRQGVESAAPSMKSAPVSKAVVPKRSPVAKSKVSDGESVEESANRAETPSNSRKLLWVLGTVVVLIGAVTYSGWRWWYQPKIAQEQLAAAVAQLRAAEGESANIQEEFPKIRTLSWVSTAYASAGESEAAKRMLTSASGALESFPPGSIRDELACRTFVARAFAGDPEGALQQVTELKQARMNLMPKEDMGSLDASTSAPVTHYVPLREDEAMKAIAIAFARQGKIKEAREVIDRISDSQRACEALAEVAIQTATIDKDAATVYFQAIEGRAKQIKDAAAKADLCCLVADRMFSIFGKSESNLAFVTEALSTASSGTQSTGPVDVGKVLSQARALRTMWTINEKEKFQKQITEVTASAGSLTVIRDNKAVPDQPDHLGRSQAYTAIALAWNEAGDEEMVEQSIDEAIQHASNAVDFKRERGLANIVAGLAEMRRFEHAMKIFNQLNTPDQKAIAGEALSYWLGWEGLIEEAKDLANQLPSGEPRCRGFVALNYGLRHTELERWW